MYDLVLANAKRLGYLPNWIFSQVGTYVDTYYVRITIPEMNGRESKGLK